MKPDVLLKIRAAVGGSVETVAGMTSYKLLFNGKDMLRVSEVIRADWQAFLQRNTLERFSIGGKGLFKDQSSDALIRQLFFGGSTPVWQVVIPDFGTLEGPLRINALEFHSDDAGDVTFEMDLQNTVPLKFERS